MVRTPKLCQKTSGHQTTEILCFPETRGMSSFTESQVDVDGKMRSFLSPGPLQDHDTGIVEGFCPQSILTGRKAGSPPVCELFPNPSQY